MGQEMEKGKADEGKTLAATLKRTMRKLPSWEGS